MTTTTQGFIATHLDASHEAAILTGLRLLVSDMRAQAGLPINLINMLDGNGDWPALEPDAIEAFADALANDTWLCQTTTARDDVPPAPATGVLAKLSPELQAWIVDEMGMVPELAGGGCVQLRHTESSGAYVLVTDSGGTGLPTWQDWCVGAYPDTGASDAGEAMLTLYSTDRPHPLSLPLTLRQAVAAACAVVAEYAPIRGGMEG